jgi:hypothetical protein
MRISILIFAFLLLIAVSNNQASLALTPESTLAVHEREKALQRDQKKELDRVERQKQLPAIIAIFERHTSKEQANRLAYLCYETTIDTPFKPIDLAELALAETGGHGLSGNAVSSEGALGVWQLMPQRARSHGYAPAEMKKDERCAEAAVRELAVKLKVADGNLAKAKRLYCGAGKQARLYEVKIRKYRKEIMRRMENQEASILGT